ncbi:MAG TPA: hypothetical protein VF997_12715 [Polyangia bacterium]
MTKPDTQRAVRALLAAARRERDKLAPVVAAEQNRPAPRRAARSSRSIQP